VPHPAADPTAGRASAWLPQDDVPLVRAAQSGDASSFDVLYRRHARTIRAVLLGRITRDDVEDLVQEAFLSAWRQIGQLRDPAAFAGWVVAIARHLHIDQARRTRPMESLDSGDRPDRNAIGSGRVQRWHSGGHEDRAASDRLDAARALQAIQQLPEAYRATLLLRLVEGMTGPEIALRTGLTPDSVRVNLCRGMKLLREGLQHATARERAAVVDPGVREGSSSGGAEDRWPVSRERRWTR
jgi:RNA polymerase sigma-70 factor, ECF subfamily